MVVGWLPLESSGWTMTSLRNPRTRRRLPSGIVHLAWTPQATAGSDAATLASLTSLISALIVAILSERLSASLRDEHIRKANNAQETRSMVSMTGARKKLWNVDMMSLLVCLLAAGQGAAKKL